MKFFKQYDSQNINYIVYAMFILTSAIALTSWITIHPDHIIASFLKIIRYMVYFGCVFCIVRNIVNKRYSIRSFYFLITLVFVSGIAMITSGERTIFLFTLLLGCIYGCDGNLILKMSCLIQGSVLLTTVFAAVTGITINPIVDEERMRYSLGFAWASYAPNLLLFVSMQYMLIRRNKLSWFELIIIEILNIFFFGQTDTKLPFLVLTCLVCVMSFNKITKLRKYLLFLKHRFFKLKSEWIFLPGMCAMLAIFLPLYKQKSLLWKLLDKGFSGRMTYGKNAIMEYGFSLLGQHINMEGFSITGRTSEVYNYVDSSYLHIAIRYGIILLVLVCLLYCMGLLKMHRRKDGRAVFFLIVILFLCMEEPYLYDVAFNLFPVFIFCDKDALNAPFYLKTVHKKQSKYIVGQESL